MDDVVPQSAATRLREDSAREKFNSIRLRTQFLRDAQRTLESVRKAGRKTVGKPQPIVPIIGPSQSGKTTIIDDLCARIALKEPLRPGHHPILKVTLTANSTVKSLGLDIVNAFGADALPHEVASKAAKLGGARRRDRTMAEILHIAHTALLNAGVEMLVLDEMHHLKNLDSEKTKWSVTEAVKWLSIEGACPIVCIGIRRLAEVVTANVNPQFAARCIDPILLEPYDFENEKQRDDFCGFLDGIDEELVVNHIFDRTSNLIQKGWPERFYDFSLGIVGRASRLIAAAMVVAIRAGHDRIELEDLSRATATWGVRLGFTDHDPWTMEDDRLRDFSIVRKAAREAK